MLCLAAVRKLVLMGYGDDDVRRSLRYDLLVEPEDAQLAAVRAGLRPPKAFKPLDESHLPSCGYLLELGLEEWFRMTPDARDAVAILRAPRQRELVEAASILGAPVQAVVLALEKLFQLRVRPSTVLLFQRLFFSTSTMSRSQLRIVVERHVKNIVGRVSGEDERAAQRALRADSRILALVLPNTSLAWGTVLLAQGWSVPKQELGLLLSQLEQVAVVRAGQAVLRGNREDAKRADSYVSVLQKVHAIREGLATPTDVLMKGLSTFRLQTSEASVPTIAELAGGCDNYTVDLNPPSAQENELLDDDAEGTDIADPAAE